MNDADGGPDECSVSIPNFEIAWSDENCRWRMLLEPPPGVEMAPRAIGPEPIGFSFTAPSSSLDRLSIILATYMRQNTVPVNFSLRDAVGRLLAESTLQPERIVDNAMAPIMDLSGLSFGVGASYQVEIVSKQARPDDCFAVYMLAMRGGCYQTPSHLMAFRNERLFTWRAGERGLNASPPNPPALVICGPAGARLMRARHAADLLALGFPGQRFDVVEAETAAQLWPMVRDVDAVVLAGADDLEVGSPTGLDAFCFELHRRGVATIHLAEAEFGDAARANGTALSGTLAQRARERRETAHRCRFVLDSRRLKLEDMAQPERLDGVPLGLETSFSSMVLRARAARLPRVCLVSVLYKKAGIIRAFIDRVMKQDFPGPIDLVLVDDCSPENEAEIARAAADELVASGVCNRSIMVIANDQNAGNCASRLAGLAAREADIYIVMDCDCLINDCFVSAHVFEHARPDVDVVIGPLNVEAGARDPMDLVRALEAAPELIDAESALQDPVQPDGFLNCITRNFSIKRRQLQVEPLFDLDFSYSVRPGSGFGWEDVEMGYRLYRRGAVIRYTRHAFSVHASHASSVPEALKVQGSINNFERLFVKHPDLQFVARRWAVETFEKIARWAQHEGVDGGPAMQSLRGRFESVMAANAPLIAGYRPPSRRLRILSYRWHAAHQYELYKLPHDFTLVTGVGDNGMINSWSYDQRPLHPNVRFRAFSEIDPDDFDAAILHFDENILHPNLCNNVIPSCWGDPFFAFLAMANLPKIAICHGTPQFVGQYGLNQQRIDSFAVHESSRQMLVDLLARNRVKVVCNSHQALAEWRFVDARVIWHGFDPQEFPKGTLTRDILVLPMDRYRPHYRGAWEHVIVSNHLNPDLRIETAVHGGAPMEPRGTNGYAVRAFRSYIDRIRQFTVYLNTTLRSPMPRSRGEAMMTGVIPVSLQNHDVDRFIENGVNGFYSNDPVELSEWINDLFKDENRKSAISAAARRTAIDLFNHDRYLTSWQRLLTGCAGP